MVAEKYKSITQKGAIPMCRYVGQDIEDFLEDKKVKSSNTETAYRTNIKEFLNEMFETDIDHVTVEQLEVLDYDLFKKYLKDLKKEKNNSNSTINRKRAAILSMYRRLNARGKINIKMDTLDGVEKLPEDSERVAYIRVNDALEIADWLEKNEKHDGTQKKLIIYMLIETGNRIREILNLEWSNFENIEGKILMKGKGKGNKEYSEVIVDELFEMLVKNKKDGKKVFTIKYTTMYQAIKRGMEALGLNGSAHSFKRTALTFVANSTGDMKAVQRKGKHSSTDMPARYMEDTNAVANGVFSALHGVDKDLFKNTEHETLLKAIENMGSDFKTLLNAEINRINKNK